MENQDYLRKLHGEILRIMDEIHRICTRNGLRYYLVGGTLLGAVRHQGFIPWDDDLDIAMPRVDFDRFIRIAEKELGPEFYLNWITTNPNYWLFFPKVCLRNTTFDEGVIKSDRPMGIFIDVFPLDLSPAYSPGMEVLKRRIQRLSYLYLARGAKEVKTLRLCLYKMASFFISNENCFKWQRRVALSVCEKGKSHYANFGSQYALRKQTMPVEWYGEGVTVSFEGKEYNAPTEYQKVLRSIYGENYMLLPPLEKRRSHYPERVVFSDQTELIFEKAPHRVTVEEQ
ncbi:LicD family protein [Parabacteroides distasonis]|uniref:LicD family protein n=1 Tax=Parabacteroides distasonis TaxID=823 RepID=A0A4S2F4G9_PARDI|nr:LicD family protein [Parabacteroides distasonis]TGY63878.1 LicD family protein [Parabacteroides distasonis]